MQTSFSFIKQDNVQTNKHRQRIDHYYLSDEAVLDGDGNEWKLLTSTSNGPSRNPKWYDGATMLVCGERISNGRDGCDYPDSIPFVAPDDQFTVENLARSFASVHRLEEAEQLLPDAKERFAQEIARVRKDMREKAFATLYTEIERPEDMRIYVQSYQPERGEICYERQQNLQAQGITLNSIAKEDLISAALYVLNVTETPHINRRLKNLVNTPKDQREFRNDTHDLTLSVSGMWELKERKNWGRCTEHLSYNKKDFAPKAEYEEYAAQSYQQLQNEYPDPIVLEQDGKYFAALPNNKTGKLMVHAITTEKYAQPTDRFVLYDPHMFPIDDKVYASPEALEKAGYSIATPPKMPSRDEFHKDYAFAMQERNGIIEVHSIGAGGKKLLARFSDQEAAEAVGWITPEREKEKTQQRAQQEQEQALQEQRDSIAAAKAQAEAALPQQQYRLNRALAAVHWGIDKDESLINDSNIVTWAKDGAKLCGEILPKKVDVAYDVAVVKYAAAKIIVEKAKEGDPTIDMPQEILKAKAQGWAAGFTGKDELIGAMDSALEDVALESYEQGEAWREHYPHLAQIMEERLKNASERGR
ncbi:MAG: hypothetical protein EAY76_05275 [Alphaproteobacteria bacterium]|nr:MAG: hypothetical protein EAY76_05275 [Alphaproteobacteria bacterium]